MSPRIDNGRCKWTDEWVALLDHYSPFLNEEEEEEGELDQFRSRFLSRSRLAPNAESLLGADELVDGRDVVPACRAI